MRSTRLVRVCVWRCSEETATRHRSPLLDAGLHTSVNSLKIDILYTCSSEFTKVSRLGLVENMLEDSVAPALKL